MNDSRGLQMSGRVNIERRGERPPGRGDGGRLGIAPTARRPGAGVRGRFMRALFAAAIWLGAIGFAMPVAADETVHRLTQDGASLGTLFTDGKLDDLRFTVALDGDVPDATHVWAIIGGSLLRQRTNEGYWIPWSGRIEDLIDNRFPVAGDTVVFKVLDEDIGDDNQGITIAIGYRTGEVLKYGYFGLLPEGGGQ